MTTRWPLGLPPGVTPPVLGLVAAGGALGSLARYGLEVAVPPSGTGLPVATLVTNVLGCLLIGAVAVTVPDGGTARAFVGAGVLGGFTTFSTFAVGTERLLAAGAPALALSYVLASLAGGLAAVACGAWLARAARRGQGSP